MSIVTRLQAGWPKNCHLIPQGEKAFFCSPDYPYQLWGLSNLKFSGLPGTVSSGVWWSECEADQYSAEVRNVWSHISTPPHPFYDVLFYFWVQVTRINCYANLLGLLLVWATDSTIKHPLTSGKWNVYHIFIVNFRIFWNKKLWKGIWFF